jgi:hypothetical protein
MKIRKTIVEQAKPPQNAGGGGATPPRNTSGGGATPPRNAGGGATPPRNTGGGGATPPTNTGGATNPNARTIDPAFSCVAKAEGTSLKPTSSKNQVRVNYEDGSADYYWVNGHFQHHDKDNVIIYKGKWKCDGADNYTIDATDGAKYSSKTGRWVEAPSSGSSSGGSSSGGGNTQNRQAGTTFTNTNLTDADIKAGKIVKLGMKGDIVGKIQDLLINKGFKRVSKTGLTDNTFGNRTKRMVQAFQAWAGLNDDGTVGPKTWAALNDASSGSASPSAATTSNTQPEKSSEEVPGSDAKIMQESLKKKLRKNLEIYI